MELKFARGPIINQLIVSAIALGKELGVDPRFYSLAYINLLIEGLYNEMVDCFSIIWENHPRPSTTVEYYLALGVLIGVAKHGKLDDEQIRGLSSDIVNAFRPIFCLIRGVDTMPVGNVVETTMEIGEILAGSESKKRFGRIRKAIISVRKKMVTVS